MIIADRQLRKRIEELKKYRKLGLHTPAEIEEYENERYDNNNIIIMIRMFNLFRTEVSSYIYPELFHPFLIYLINRKKRENEYNTRKQKDNPASYFFSGASAALGSSGSFSSSSLFSSNNNNNNSSGSFFGGRDSLANSSGSSNRGNRSWLNRDVHLLSMGSEKKSRVRKPGK